MRLSLPLAVATLCLAGAAPASAAQASRDTVGGPLLASDGVVVQPVGHIPPPPRVSARSWLVADAGTGDVLAAKAAHQPRLPASTLKILTAITLLPLLDPRQTVTATRSDAAVDGSKVGLVPGMKYTVDTLFTAMLVVSANDAANALAGAVGGPARAIAAMNAEARHLQAEDTVAKTPSGLDAPGERTSAYDLALIGRAGLAMPAFRHYIGIHRSMVPAPGHRHFEIDTHNHLLATYPGDIGVKNGYTIAAQATYVGAATRNGHTIIITMLHARPNFWQEAQALLDWGFAADGKVVPVGTLVGPASPPRESLPESVRARATVALASRRHGSEVRPWQLLALAFSAAVAVSVTGRRGLRRRRRRLALPPL